MNRVKKIILSIAAIFMFVLLFTTNEVQARGLVHQTWGMDAYEGALFFREYTTPYDGTLAVVEDAKKSEKVSGAPRADYYNSNKKKRFTSYWIYNNTPANDDFFNSFYVNYYSYNNTGIRVYGDRELAIYGDGGTHKIGYTSLPAIGNTLPSNIFGTAQSVKTKVSNKNNAGIMVDRIEDNNANMSIYDVSAIIFGEDQFYGYSNGTLIYRMAMISASKETTSPTIYVSDKILDKNIMYWIKENDSSKFFEKLGYKNCLRVSMIGRVAPNVVDWDLRTSIHVRTAYDMAQIMYERNFSNNTKGLADSKSFGSAINHYDNILVFPVDADRKVYFRYVNIGEEENITRASIDKAEAARETIPEATNKNNTYIPVYYKLGDDEYEIGINDPVNTYNNDSMEYLGYHVANSTSIGAAEANIATLVSNNAITNMSNKYVVPTTEPTNDEYIVVEFYYRNKKVEEPPQETGWETEIHHLKFNELEEYEGEYGTGIKETRGEEIPQVIIDKTNAVNIPGYKLVGIKADSNNLIESGVGSLFTYTESSVSLNKDRKYAYFAYQKERQKETGKITVKHIVYDAQLRTGDVVRTETINIEEDEYKVITPLSGYAEHLGVIKDRTTTPLLTDNWNKEEYSYNISIADANTTIYLGYVEGSIEIKVRHILYDEEGKFKQILYESTEETTSPSVNPTYQVAYDYKGYIQTMNRAYPERLMAYVTKPVCHINANELKTKSVYVNFLYKEKKQNVGLESPNRNVGGNLSAEGVKAPGTTDCETSIYTDKDNPFTTVSGNKIRLGIKDLKTRYIAGLSVSDESTQNPQNANLITYAVVKTNITSYGTDKDYNSLKPFIYNTNLKLQIYKFIVPYIYTNYELQASRIYKLKKSEIYDTDADKTTQGPDLLSKTGDNPYEITYNLGAAKFKIEENKKDDYYIKFVDGNLPPIEAEIAIDGALTSCKDISFHNMGNNSDDSEQGGVQSNPLVYCNDEGDSLKTTKITAANGLISEAGIALQWLVGEQQEGTNVTELMINAHVYPTEGYEEGVIKTERVVGDTAKNFYYKFKNDTEDVKTTIFDKIIRFFQMIFNSIADAFAKLFESDYEEVNFWEEQDTMMMYLNTSASKFFQKQPDGILFNLNLVSHTSGYKLKLDDAGNSTVIAETNEEQDSKYFSIDSSNFVSNRSTETKDPYILDEFTFNGNVDLTNIGGMRITEKGKKMYTEGFALSSDKLNMASLDDNNSVIADINKDAVNGTRILYGLATYQIEAGEESKISGDIVDNIYYSDLNNEKVKYHYIVNDSDLLNTYSYKKKNSDIINVYTPIKLESVTPLKSDYVDGEPVSQLEPGSLNANVSELVTIESGFHFYITLAEYNVAKEKIYKYNTNVELLPYLKGYYIKFSYDVKNLRISLGDTDSDTNDADVAKIVVNGNEYEKGTKIKANTWIYVEVPKDETKRNDYKTIKVAAKGVDIADKQVLTYTVRAVANNINKSLLTTSFADNRFAFYNTFGNICNDKVNTTNTDDNGNIVAPAGKGYDDIPVYYDEITNKVEIKQIDRLFDFRVTDVNDVDWKNVFRDENTGHNGVAYYVGDKKWVANKTEPVSRTTSEIGTDPITTLPIGPYKNTDITYTKAPKLGYRISFDVKVSGKEAARDVIVTPSYYFIDENGIRKNNIKLYYKDENNNYVNIENYKLTFTPKDGYRLLDGGEEYLSTKEVSLGNLNELTLQKETMSITTEDYQIFYGEFKLPNTTVAVEDGKTPTKENILKNGYIAVKFDITTTYEDEELKYSRPMDKKVESNTIKQWLVTQWSFEGFLGARYGKESLKADTGIQLENKKKLKATDATTYGEVIGTVVLFDSDERAASDFN